MRQFFVAILLLQIVAGTPEDKLFQQVASETNPDSKLQLLFDFENRFPQSKVLPDVYLMVIDIYRQKGDRKKIIEYGEKTLKADQRNVTAMMALSRNYALEGKDLDRAVKLAEEAVSLIEQMKAQPTPARFTDAQWKGYLQSTEGAARDILQYAKAIKGR
jgi:tetratricopeptide (TPR) repeat protein